MARSYHWPRSHRWQEWIVAVACVALALAGCGGGQAAPNTPQSGGCYPSDTDSSSNRATSCFSSGSPVDAIVAVGVAATATAVVGCTVNGCLPPYRCNTQSKLCEVIRCGETTPCPHPYTCDLEDHTCK